jgi:hypothetical protein
VGVIKPSSNIAKVVLPLPLSPAMVTIVGFPSSTWRDILDNAVVEVFESKPRE